MTCPFCEYAAEDMSEIENHVTAEHPEWARQAVSKSVLRRWIVQGRRAPGDKDQPGCFTGGAIGQRSRPLTGKEIDEMTQLCEPGPPNRSWIMPECDNPNCPVGCPDSHCAPYPETACGNAATVNDWEPIESQLGANGLRHDMRIGPCSCGATHTRDNPAPTGDGEAGGKHGR